MRILHIIPTLGSGGAERFVVDLCNELVNQGHEVGLCLLFKYSKSDSQNFYLEELDPRIFLLTTDKHLGFDTRIFRRVYKTIHDFNPDVVHSHLRAITYLLPAALLLRKIKFFHTVHNDALREAGDKFNSFVRKFLFKRRIVHPVTISDASDESFVKYYGSNCCRTLIYNGAKQKNANRENANEIMEARQNGHTRILVNVARLMPQKNQIALVEALKRLPEVELFMVGNNEGCYADEVRKVMPLNCHMLGMRKNPLDYMAAADAFILPSIFEGMPISLIEAMSVGAIPIVTKVGGMINMIDDLYNGLTIEAPDVDSIVNTISKFLALTDVDKSFLRENALDSSKIYSIEECAKKYIKLFNETLIN